MLNYSIKKSDRILVAISTVALSTLLSGCASSEPPVQSSSQTPAAMASTSSSSAASTSTNAASGPESLLLREGDTVHITFPGAPTLDSTQTIRRDGKITLDMVGEIKASGLSPHGLELELLKDYDSQLVDKEVTVTVQSSVFSVSVTGAVMHSGRITADRVMTPLDALVEAGVDYTKANLKSVTVIRQGDNGKVEHFKINVDRVIHGKSGTPFVLKPNDILYVPERFSWL